MRQLTCSSCNRGAEGGLAVRKKSAFLSDLLGFCLMKINTFNANRYQTEGYRSRNPVLQAAGAGAGAGVRGHSVRAHAPAHPRFPTEHQAVPPLPCQMFRWT